MAALPVEPYIVLTAENTRQPRPRPVWLFDNMIARLQGEVADGHSVTVHDKSMKFLGSAVYNSRSKIRARMFSLGRTEFDEAYVKLALAQAVARRGAAATCGGPCRLVFGEADFLPGLIVDLFGRVCVIQFQTLAANRHREFIAAEAGRLTGARAVVMRFDAAVRLKEGLEVLPPVVRGTVPKPLRVEFDGYCQFADPIEGQKTGLFLDQRENRKLLAPFAAGARVLDMYCHTGGWALACLAAGAAEALGIDSSASALSYARMAAEAGGFASARFEESDAFKFLDAAVAEGRKYDIVICDPPAFAKSRAMLADAMRGYLSLNYRAMKLLTPNGVLATCSCSQAVSAGDFDGMLEQSARNARMHFHVVSRTGQPMDHPVLLGFPESDYLKCLILRRVQ